MYQDERRTIECRTGTEGSQRNRRKDKENSEKIAGEAERPAIVGAREDIRIDEQDPRKPVPKLRTIMEEISGGVQNANSRESLQDKEQQN